MSKGDKPRNCYSEAFRSGWDRIFGGSKDFDSGEESEDPVSTPAAPPDDETVGYVREDENINVRQV